MNLNTDQLGGSTVAPLADESADGPASADQRFVEALVERGALSDSAGARALRVVSETGECMVGALVKLGYLSEAAAADVQAQHLGLQRASNSDFPSVAIELSDVSRYFLREHEAVPLQIHDGELIVAVWNAFDDFTSSALAFACERPVIQRVATRTEIEVALRMLYPAGEPDGERGASGSAAFLEDEVEQLRDLASDAPVIRLVQRLISDAVARRASDIHFESTEAGLQVRYRIDGLLQNVERLALALRDATVSRLKIMASLNIAERRLPQDGRVRVTVQGKDIDFRVATTPTLHGESVVLRILDRQEVSLDFETLGFEPELVRTLRQAISKPHGIVLVTGPTGSGKTTTLYAALKELHTPEKKILTIEDPVEYTLVGVNQVHVKPQIGLTFAGALRAFLRQDPDIMMVGEIRDRETAEIAIQAALTGHLLLSTLHTNSAAAAVTRLLDMGIDDFLLTSTLNLIVGQRLVRRLCSHCRTPYAVSAEIRHRFELPAGVDSLYHALGCEQCDGTGYLGRIAVIEILELSGAIQKLVLTRADAGAIERQAVEDGMRTLFRHGVERALDGDTTLEEVLRVTRAN